MRAASIVLGLIALLQLAAFAWYSPGNDWARDLFMAARIADGGAWPARGPVIGGLFHTGPLWYFVVALPVALGAGFAATTLFVGALATAKIALAARLGCRLGGARLALPFAALVAVPGWGVYESLQLTHTAVLQSLAIAAMLPLLTLWRDGAAKHWLVFGAFAGLAVQAHPVAGVLALPAFAVAWRRRARLVGDGPALLAGIAVALLPALPMLLAEAREGWPALAAIAGAPSPARAFAEEAVALAGASTVGAVGAMRDWASGVWSTVVIVGGLALAAAWLASLPALARDPAARRRFAFAVSLWVTGSAWLLAVHVRVPFYMAAVTAPALAFVFAQALAVAPPWVRGTGLAAALALATIAPLSVIATMHRGHGEFALASIHDIRAEAPPRVPLALLPMWGFDALAARACGHAELRVHGGLGALVDFYQGLPFARACAKPVRVRLGGEAGVPGALDWAGATPHTLRILGDPSPTWDAALALAPRRVIAPGVPVEVTTEPRYPHRPVCTGESVAHVVEFDAAGDEAIAAHSPLFAFDGFAVVDVRRDGRLVNPASSTNAGALYLPGAGRAAHAWRVRFTACDATAASVVTLPMRAPR